jgi:putative serine protease PepD
MVATEPRNRTAGAPNPAPITWQPDVAPAAEAAPLPPLPPNVRHRVDRGARPRRPRWGVLGAAFVLLAAASGALGGWAVNRFDGRSVSTTVTRTVTRVSTTYQGERLDVAAALAVAEPAIVSVGTTYTIRQGPFNNVVEGAGTGMVLTADGEILTNAHVVADATKISVTLPGSTEARVAHVVGVDEAADVAVIKLEDTSGLTAAHLGSSDDLRVGDDVMAIGNALALEGGPTVTRGIVSALDRSIETDGGTLEGMIQTDAAISSGNSGGPLVNAAGEVVGMNSAVASSSGSSTAENIGFAIPIDTVLKVVDQIRAAS